MKITVTIPETIVTLETKAGTLPDGTYIQLSVPVRGLVTTPQPTPTPQPVIPALVPQPVTPVIPAPIPAPEPVSSAPVARFDRKYTDVVFRSAAKRFDTIGKATDLGLSDANWTMVLNVRFVNFEDNHRVIGSATTAGAGSSLQIGVLQGGILWVDTFMGAMTADVLELNRWYEIAISHSKTGEEKIYIDKKLSRHAGNIPVFKSDADVYVGRWGNTYADFDIERLRIYPLLTTEEIESI
jgi:hypothetical protein